MHRFRALAILSGLSVSVLSSSAHADTLLVISDSEGMYGSPEISSVMEHFGAQLVASNLSDGYRRTYQFSMADGVPFAVLWQTILNERQPGESIDIFSMEHGPNPMALDQLGDSSKIPVHFVRRFFSTACDNWGDFTANTDGSGLQKSDFNTAIHDDLKALGVQEYVLHAGLNTTGLFEIPYLIHEFQKGDSWLVGASRAFDEADTLLAPLIPNFKGLSAQDNFGKIDFLSWGLLLSSRPVVGGANLPEVLSQIKTRNLLPAESGELMLAPNAALIQSLQANCPDVFADPDGGPCKTVTGTATQPQAIEAVGLLLERLFEVYGVDEDGCVKNLAPFQTLVGGLLKRKDGLSPAIESLCVERDGDQDVHFRLSLGPTPEAALRVLAGENAQNSRNMDSWEVLPPTVTPDEETEATLSSLSLDRDIEIRVHGSVKSASIDVDGLDGSLDIPGAPGIAKIVTHDIGLNGFTIQTSGKYSVRLAAPILNIPVSFSGTSGDDDMIVRVFGIPFHVSTD